MITQYKQGKNQGGGDSLGELNKCQPNQYKQNITKSFNEIIFVK